VFLSEDNDFCLQQDPKVHDIQRLGPQTEEEEELEKLRQSEALHQANINKKWRLGTMKLTMPVTINRGSSSIRP
jgi:hypothetical protein